MNWREWKIWDYMPTWLHVGWWDYLLSKPDSKGVSRWTVFWCRLRGHPDGMIWHNPQGLEPDTRCSNCRDWIG